MQKKNTRIIRLNDCLIEVMEHLFYLTNKLTKDRRYGKEIMSKIQKDKTAFLSSKKKQPLKTLIWNTDLYRCDS